MMNVEIAVIKILVVLGIQSDSDDSRDDPRFFKLSNVDYITSMNACSVKSIPVQYRCWTYKKFASLYKFCPS